MNARVVVLLLFAASPALAEDCKVAVMPLTGQGIDSEKVHVLAIATETMATEVATSTGCAVITEADIASMMDYEAQRQMCGGSSDSCMAEIGSALGVDFVVIGSLGKIGDVYTLNSRLIDIERVQVVARVEETARNEGYLRVTARNAARGLFRLPPVPDDEAEGDSFRLTRALLFGGISIGVIGLVVTVVGAALTGGAVGLSQIPSLPGELKYQALTQWAPLAALVIAAGVVLVPIGVTLTGLGYVLE